MKATNDRAKVADEWAQATEERAVSAATRAMEYKDFGDFVNDATKTEKGVYFGFDDWKKNGCRSLSNIGISMSGEGEGAAEGEEGKEGVVAKERAAGKASADEEVVDVPGPEAAVTEALEEVAATPKA